MGDWDIAYWRINAAGEQTLGDTFDYIPIRLRNPSTASWTSPTTS
jgi:hypothetical protein